MAKQDDYARITIRIPMEIYDQIQDAAESAQRSLNGEIIQRLSSNSAFTDEHLQLLSGTIDQARRVMSWQLRQKREWRAIARTQSIAINGMTLAISSLCNTIVDQRENVPRDVLEAAEMLLKSVGRTLDFSLTTMPETEEYDSGAEVEKLVEDWDRVAKQLGLARLYPPYSDVQPEWDWEDSETDAPPPVEKPIKKPRKRQKR